MMREFQTLKTTSTGLIRGSHLSKRHAFPLIRNRYSLTKRRADYDSLNGDVYLVFFVWGLFTLSAACVC